MSSSSLTEQRSRGAVRSQSRERQNELLMKFTFRVTLLTILLSLLVLTVGALGYSFYNYAYFTAADLSVRILRETSMRVDHQLNDQLFVANEQGELNRRILESPN